MISFTKVHRFLKQSKFVIRINMKSIATSNKEARLFYKTSLLEIYKHLITIPKNGAQGTHL